jgi:hypothetical protein
MQPAGGPEGPGRDQEQSTGPTSRSCGGFDVQRLLPRGQVEEVRKGVHDVMKNSGPAAATCSVRRTTSWPTCRSRTSFAMLGAGRRITASTAATRSTDDRSRESISRKERFACRDEPVWKIPEGGKRRPEGWSGPRCGPQVEEGDHKLRRQALAGGRSPRHLTAGDPRTTVFFPASRYRATGSTAQIIFIQEMLITAQGDEGLVSS